MAGLSKKPRVFLDANILLAGTGFPRWSYELLQHAVNDDFQMVLSPLVIQEVRRHLQKKERFQKYLPFFEAFLQRVNYQLVPDPSQAEVEANLDLIRDVNDVPIALAAINAKVDYLISEDKDLTTQDESTAELRRHVKVMLSGTFLREVMGWTSEALEAIRHRQWTDMLQDNVETEVNS